MSDTTPDTTAIRALIAACEGADFPTYLTRRQALGKALDFDTVRALCDGYDEAQRLRDEAADNWRSWEREATEHARTLGLIGAPRTGEPLSEGEKRRYEAAVVRGLQAGRAADLAAERERCAALVADLRALVDDYDLDPRPAFGAVPIWRLRRLLDRHGPAVVPMSPDKGHVERPCDCAGHYLACDKPCPDYWDGRDSDLRERIAQRIDQAWAVAKDRAKPGGGDEYLDGYLAGL